jgi:hypothetical protein
MSKEKKLNKLIYGFLKDVEKITGGDEHEAIAVMVLTIEVFTDESGKHRECLVHHASHLIQKIEANMMLCGEVWH